MTKYKNLKYLGGLRSSKNVFTRVKKKVEKVRRRSMPSRTVELDNDEKKKTQP